MRRRNLRLPSSSDEDDESPNPQTLTSPNPNPNPNPVPRSPIPRLEISDDSDFADAFDDRSPPTIAAQSVDTPNPNPNSSSVLAIDEFLGRLGLRLRREWLESCVLALERSGMGFARLDLAGNAKLCFERFLLADMNYCGAGVLPANVHLMHKVELEGPFVLQVDEIINISSPLRERYHDVPVGVKRCLKLSLTDGIQRVFGMEYRPIKDLGVLSPAGLKVAIRNIHIRRGLLMLVPEALEVLGGLVEDLEAARKRLVDEVNKPPRGKRKRGTVPLAKRASLAAWPSGVTNNDAAPVCISMQQNLNNLQPATRAATLASSRSVAEAIIIEGSNEPDIGGNTMLEPTAHVVEGRLVEEFAASHVTGSIVDEPASPDYRQDTGPNAMIPTSPHMEDTNVLDVVDAVGDVEHSVPTSPRGGGADASYVMDAVSAEHSLILTGEREIPFTYLACLLAKWTTQKDDTPFIQGKIKCILTGVKSFQFKHRSAYQLHVYVDDGSLIAEVLIDHQVVEKGIGHSPEEVTSALSSSDKQTVADMREAMKKFQLYLAKFEGTMLVEINANSAFPVVLEMNHGCLTSDAWLLLQRLKKIVSPRKQLQSHLNPINLSP